MRTPAYAEKGSAPRWQRLFFAGLLLVLVFWQPWEERDIGATYVLSQDSISWVAYNGWLDPWRSHRPIGYSSFLYLFLAPEPQQFSNATISAGKAGIDIWSGDEKPVYAIAKNIGFATKFATIALVQRVVLALGVVVFYLSLCRWFAPFFSFAAMVGALWLAPPPDPRYILSEPLSCALTWFSGAFLLWAPKCSRQATCFALACLCASLAFLVRPQTLSLTGLCSLLFLYQIVWGKKPHSLKVFLRTTLAFCPLLIAYGYIFWLSVLGGQLFLHTHPNMYYSSFCFFAEADDAKYMPTERAKKFTAYFGERKAELIHKLKNGLGGYQKIRLGEHASPVRKRAILGDALAYRALGEVWKKFKEDRDIGHLSLLGRNIFGKELKSGLFHRHAGKMLVTSWQNFIGGLGYYRDVWRLTYFTKASFVINIVALGLCVCALLGCPKARWPLVIMLGIHMMSLLAAALGHFMLGRYVRPTEAFLLLAGILSCAALVNMLYHHFLGTPYWTDLKQNNVLKKLKKI